MQIIGSGKAVGSHVVESRDLEKELEVRRGWIEKATGIKSRYYVDTRKSESALSLGIVELTRHTSKLKKLLFNFN